MAGQEPRRSRHVVVALAVYLLLAAAYTWPLLREARSHVAADPFDPVLNASILWWNATVVPFTAGWWSPPYFFPTENVSAFTENLVGLGPIATPIFWLTRQPVLTYNLTFVLTWPLSAITAYLLAWVVLRRVDAAFIAGLAFGFAPYRLTQIGHIQVLALFWLPIALAGLHRYLEDRRRRWLVLFGAAWILQALSNGYYMFFGGVLIALWIAYFGSTRANRRAAGSALGAWILATLTLVPVMWKYRAVHEHYGLTRGLEVAMSFGAQPIHWLRVTGLNWFWSRWLSDAGAEFNLFPGMTIPILLTILGIAWCVRWTGGDRRALRWTLLAVAIVSAGIVAVTALTGPWRLDWSGVIIRLSHVTRPLTIAAAAAVGFSVVTPAARVAWRRRSPLLFYALATGAAAVLACGPALRHGTDVLLAPAPYRWLMAVMPGLDELRVVARFWMIGALGLALTGAAAWAWLTPRRGLAARAMFCVVCLGLALDGWPKTMPMAAAPELWPDVEPPGVARALIELPLGPSWDAAATFRSIGHRRRVVNGVSGYDPPHYAPLQKALAARDPSALLTMASFGPLDVVVDRSQDPDGSLVRYVEGISGVKKVVEAGPRVLYRMPDGSR